MSGLNEHPYSNGLFQPLIVADINPAAGTDISYTNSVNARFKLVHLSFVLTTDANVATRIVHVQYDKGGTSFPVGACQIGQVASTAFQYYFSTNESRSITTNDLTRHAPIVDSPVLFFSDIVETLITNIQGTDQISAVRLIFEMQPSNRQF